MSMMKKLIYTIAFTLAGLAGMAQTNQPLPSGAVPFGATTYLSPSDSTIWLYKERDGTAVNLGSWYKVDSLFAYGYLPSDTTNRYSFDGYSAALTASHSAGGTMVHNPSGGITHIYRKGTDGEHIGNSGALYSITSLDSGRTWGAPTLVYSDAYDNRNESAGNAPNGDIVVLFSSLDADTDTRIGVYCIRSSDGVTWSSPIEVGSSVTNRVPFGRILIRGSDIVTLLYSTAAGVADIYRSSDNGVTWSFVNSAYSGHSDVSEPSLIDLPGGGSIILVRNSATGPTNESVYQYSSTDGYTFTLDGSTNINNDIGTSAQSSVYPILFGNDLVVFAPRRFTYPTGTDSRDVDASMNIYVVDATSVIGNESSYRQTGQIIRPNGNYLSYYGYVSGVVLGDSLFAGVVSDRSRRMPFGVSNIESANIYGFRYSKVVTSKDLIYGKTAYGGYRKSNPYSGSFDYVMTEPDRFGFVDKWSQDYFAEANTGDLLAYDGNRWLPTDGPFVSRLRPIINGGDADGLGSTVGTNFTLYNSASSNLPTANGYFLNTIRANGTNNVFQMAYGWDVSRVFFRRFNTSQTNVGWHELYATNSPVITTGQFRLSALNTPPASATATGTAGEIRFGTDGRIYICTATNTWIRSEPLTTWP